MREIRGDAKSVRSLLANTKYGIDYYHVVSAPMEVVALLEVVGR